MRRKNRKEHRKRAVILSVRFFLPHISLFGNLTHRRSAFRDIPAQSLNFREFRAQMLNFHGSLQGYSTFGSAQILNFHRKNSSSSHISVRRKVHKYSHFAERSLNNGRFPRNLPTKRSTFLCTNTQLSYLQRYSTFGF